MARYRITYYYALGRSGWSESFHTTYTSPTSINSLVTSYTSVRRGVLSNRASITHIRVSDDELFRDVLFYATGLPLVGFRTEDPEPGFVAANLRLQSGPQFFRNMFIRGNVQDLFIGNTFDIASPAYAALNALAIFLKGAGVGISHQSLPSTASLVTAYDSLTGIFTVDPAIGSLSVNTPLTLTKVPRSIVPQRTWRVLEVVAANRFKLQQWNLAINIAGYGRLRNGTPTITGTTDCIVDNVTERRVGRPFGQPRGRAPVIR